ncbi:MAG: cell division protein ZapA [Ruminococcaceae bacterium]|nr:cell division protein ZapA [Oscillospiraceae bacterium]
MKQKYTITVADMELNIISDAAPDEVENIVGILDRRIRDINLKSPRCTKNEAAILCALSYCSERIAMQEAFKKVEKDAFRFAAENEKQKRTIESLQKEIDTLRKDADVMRSLLDRASITSAAPTAPSAIPEKPKYIPKATEQAVEAPAAEAAAEETVQLSLFDDVPVISPETEAAPAAPTAPVFPTEPEKTEEPKKSKPNKNRVGSMFDFLTFSDV